MASNKSTPPPAPSQTPPTTTKPVTVALSDLKSNSIPDSILLSAFGPSSLGILLVTSLPERYTQLRTRVLSHISQLSHLPPSDLETLTNPTAKYLVGWSHGKESLRDGQVDWHKGSYYVNTSFDSRDEIVEKMRQEYPGFDEYLAPNVWPDENTHQQLAGFQKDVQELVELIVDVAGSVARNIDTFATKNVENWPQPSSSNSSGDQMGYLEGVVKSSRTSKARLLHYFPSNTPQSQQQEEEKEGKEVDDSWCTIHKDHSCLTGLTSAAFFDETLSQTTQELDSSPSPTAGLYILDRSNNIHKIQIPRDALAFQTGEALELITQGKLKAVPHYVRGIDGSETDVKGRKIARNTLAVFTQPNLFELVDLQNDKRFGEWAGEIVGKNTAG